MRRRRILQAAAAQFAVLAAAPASFAAGEPAARDIMERNFQASKIKSFRSDSTMLLVTGRDEKRERKTTTFVKLQPNGVDSKLLVKFHTPTDIKGTGFLQVEHIDGDDDQWIYLPALKKSRRLVANNKKDSFVGSDFSYGDISLPKVDLFNHTLLRSEVFDRQDCHVVESVPANDTVRANTGYGKKIAWIRKDTFIEAKVEYHDLSGRLLKTQATSNHKQVQADPPRWLALSREMVNHQTGHKTILRFDNVESGIDAPDEMFTIRYLERE
ncbi:MAG: outer membrane lipoprotein-sorting protein [Pseudomonadota bacterium]